MLAFVYYDKKTIFTSVSFRQERGVKEGLKGAKVFFQEQRFKNA
jgi:hypothetical protein